MLLWSFQAKVLVPALCRVSELKSIISDATDVPPDKQLLLYKDTELKNDNAGIRNYGIVKDCSITMNIKMSTVFDEIIPINIDNLLPTSHKITDSFGEEPRRLGGEESRKVIFEVVTIIVALLFQVMLKRSEDVVVARGQVWALRRPAFRGRVEKPMEYTTTWSPSKQMEHELTRNKMKRLLRNRKKKHRTILSDSNHISSPDSASDSPSANSPSTSVGSPVASAVYEQDPTITDKHLKLFFDPPESLEELELAQGQMTLPPSNMEELLRLKQERIKSARTTCYFCHRRLQLTEQQIQCLCQEIFCKKHRPPVAHNCSIDYKQTGRSKINKDFERRTDHDNPRTTPRSLCSCGEIVMRCFNEKTIESQ
ncbi:hypothetical protein RB195_001635 [Necator americanus]|uniref:Ubiquitin-like domain-containing protein n=1 Tax=Necator americanus TaxID=51031 RepID=A0ABR1DG45_NECAM